VIGAHHRILNPANTLDKTRPAKGAMRRAGKINIHHFEFTSQNSRTPKIPKFQNPFKADRLTAHFLHRIANPASISRSQHQGYSYEKARQRNATDPFAEDKARRQDERSNQAKHHQRGVEHRIHAQSHVLAVIHKTKRMKAAYSFGEHR
jgi:hypothetical protein